MSTTPATTPVTTVEDQVEKVLRRRGRRPALVVTDGHLDLDLDGVVVSRVDAVPSAVRARATLVVVDDVADLRRVASRLTGLGRSRAVGVLVRRSEAALSLRLHPEWPPASALLARLEQEVAVTVVDFVEPVAVRSVVAAVARAATLSTSAGHGGVRIATTHAEYVPPLDPSVSAAYDAEGVHPPDVVIGAADDEPETVASAVTGRVPTHVVASAVADLAIGPVDEAVHRPVGFARRWVRPVVDLDPRSRLSATVVAELGDAQGVRVTWPVDARVVVGLAMSGVPLVSGPIPVEARAQLGDPLADLLEGASDLDDELRREERSIRLRRAALIAHATPAWRTRLAARVGVRAAAYPTVSVLLATRRPEHLEFALRQVARQRRALPGAELELVLATHGFEVDPRRVADLLGGAAAMAHTVLAMPAETVFGDVLRAATSAASGDLVLKMDDDDWYGPDVVTDLLLARGYSGADLVGMPAEMVYLEPLDVTVRRRGPSENHGTTVAGGTMLLDRTLLTGLGGFRSVRRFVDAQLLDSVRTAGGTIYRTHGLGYVLRRAGSGHTWDPGVDYFLRPGTVAAQWPGFCPSELLEHETGAP